MSGKANVVIFAPNDTVPSMQDELADGSVKRAIEAAKAAFVKYDSDGEVPVVRYGSDFHGAAQTVLKHVAASKGVNLVVIISDIVGGTPATSQAFEQLGENFALIVPVSNQGYDQEFTAKLDDHHTKASQIDVVAPADLPTEVAHDEVRVWHDALAAA